MFTRRDFLSTALKGSSLLAAGSVVPGFVYNTALAADAGKDTVLVIVELTGGNDGLHTVIPHQDDLYHKARPTLHFTKEQVVKVTDEIGIHPSLRPLERFIGAKNLAVVQGVGYPNPDRSHFESMDIWQSADPRRKTPTGWIARGATELNDKRGGIPAMHIGPNKLPLALQGAGGGAISVNDQQPYKLELGGGTQDNHKARKKLLTELAAAPETEDPADLLDFVQRRQLKTLTTLDKLEELLRNRSNSSRPFFPGSNVLAANYLPNKLQLVSELIERGFGTRVFYVALDGFDTHSRQAEAHRDLMQQLGEGISQFFQTLQQSKNDQRVVLMTFSEFGRRVQENGSKGTDHGSGSSLFVVGPAVQGGLVGEHPSLKDLDQGDLRYHTDFRRVYATLLDNWLGVDSKTVLNGKFEPMGFLKARG